MHAKEECSETLKQHATYTHLSCSYYTSRTGNAGRGAVLALEGDLTELTASSPPGKRATFSSAPEPT